MKFLLILIILYNILNSVYSAPTVTAVTNGKYGTATYITITGTGFVSSPTPVVTIGNQTCSPVIVASATSMQCQFSAQLGVANANYDVIVKVSGVSSTGGDGLFKYSVPSIQTVFQNNGRVGMILVDGPSTISGYKLNVSDSLNSVQLAVTADSSSSTIYFLMPNTIAGGQINLTLIQSFGFDPIVKTGQSLFSPTISSISPTTFDLTPTNVTVTGTYFGTTASVTMGSHIFTGLAVHDNGANCQVVFTTRSVYESPNTITAKTSTGVDMINVDNQGSPTQQPFNFTYNPPTIESTTQVNDTVEITTTNTGTDFTQISLTMGTSSVTNLVITGTNAKIIATLPHALPEGEIQFNMKAGTSNIITSTLLVTPILNSVTQAPYNGGSITISGIFLNNAHVSIVDNQQNKSNEIVCAPNSNGESIVCPVEAGNGTIDLVVTNYKNFASDPTVKTDATISSTYTIAPETPTPTDTPFTPSPTETSTPKPTETQSPTSKPEETEAPSSATTLFSPLSLIFIFISFVLLI
ncbi:hypothetical protein ACTFIU_003041 [Dictyostelium citrinum]